VSILSGQGHLLSDKVSGRQYVGGLIGYAHRSEIISCAFEGNVSGSDNYVGGLVGYSNRSPITTSFSKANVIGLKDYVGGLTGCVTGSTSNMTYSISMSYSDSTVSGTGTVGGLIGFVYPGSSIVKNSYAKGSVFGHNNIGGLIGGVGKDNEIANSHSITEVNEIDSATVYGGLVGHSHSTSKVLSTYNYWSINHSKQINSAIGIGLTSEEMKLESSFKSKDGTSGFDFEEIWFMDEKLGYPLLRWQIVVYCKIIIPKVAS
jgi:hypothetical protein